MGNELVNRWRSARQKGYRVEWMCCTYYQKQGFFATRIDARKQKGIFRSIDVVTFDKQKQIFYIIQCKRRKNYLKKEEKERIKLAATQWGAVALLCYRDKGLQFEPIL